MDLTPNIFSPEKQQRSNVSENNLQMRITLNCFPISYLPIWNELKVSYTFSTLSPSNSPPPYHSLPKSQCVLPKSQCGPSGHSSWSRGGNLIQAWANQASLGNLIVRVKTCVSPNRVSWRERWPVLPAEIQGAA